MITATLSYRSSGKATSFRFPEIPIGVKRGGERPFKCTVRGYYDGEDIRDVRQWVYSKIQRTLHPVAPQLDISPELQRLIEV